MSTSPFVNPYYTISNHTIESIFWRWSVASKTMNFLQSLHANPGYMQSMIVNGENYIWVTRSLIARHIYGKDYSRQNEDLIGAWLKIFDHMGIIKRHALNRARKGSGYDLRIFYRLNYSALNEIYIKRQQQGKQYIKDLINIARAAYEHVKKKAAATMEYIKEVANSAQECANNILNTASVYVGNIMNNTFRRRSSKESNSSKIQRYYQAYQNIPLPGTHKLVTDSSPLLLTTPLPEPGRSNRAISANDSLKRVRDHLYEDLKDRYDPSPKVIEKREVSPSVYENVRKDNSSLEAVLQRLTMIGKES